MLEGGAPHSWTSQISDSRGGSFLSWSRRANTCSECTELSVRRLTSFISIRGKRSRSCGYRRQVGASQAGPGRHWAANLDHRGASVPEPSQESHYRKQMAKAWGSPTHAWARGLKTRCAGGTWVRAQTGTGVGGLGREGQS